jgi:ABC-type enterochelin transport system permease subunit
MKTIARGMFGIVLQAVCLIAFIEVSRTSVAEIGKPLIAIISALSMSLFLWGWLRNEERRRVQLLMPVLLAVGYSIAFHLVGLVAFPGLLADADWSTDYAKSVLSVTAVMFGCYSIATGFLCFLLKRKLKMEKVANFAKVLPSENTTNEK